LPLDPHPLTSRSSPLDSNQQKGTLVVHITSVSVRFFWLGLAMRISVPRGHSTVMIIVISTSNLSTTSSENSPRSTVYPDPTTTFSSSLFPPSELTPLDLKSGTTARPSPTRAIKMAHNSVLRRLWTVIVRVSFFLMLASS